MNDLMTIREVSKLLKVSMWTLRQWDKKGLLKSVRIGTRKDRRYKVEDLEKFINK